MGYCISNADGYEGHFNLEERSGSVVIRLEPDHGSIEIHHIEYEDFVEAVLFLRDRMLKKGIEPGSIKEKVLYTSCSECDETMEPLYCFYDRKGKFYCENCLEDQRQVKLASLGLKPEEF